MIIREIPRVRWEVLTWENTIWDHLVPMSRSNQCCLTDLEFMYWIRLCLASTKMRNIHQRKIFYRKTRAHRSFHFINLRNWKLPWSLIHINLICVRVQSNLWLSKDKDQAVQSPKWLKAKSNSLVTFPSKSWCTPVTPTSINKLIMRIITKKLSKKKRQQSKNCKNKTKSLDLTAITCN